MEKTVQELIFIIISTDIIIIIIISIDFKIILFLFR